MPAGKRSREQRELDDLTSMSGGLPKEYAKMSRRQTLQAERARKQKAAADAAAKAEEIRATFMAQRKPTGAAIGARGDGSFHISFVQMGQGDCTIMSTPDGKVILVDCGTNSQDGEKTEDYNPRVRDELTALPFLRNTMSIDIVILSHPDKDHYNRLDTMLPKGYTAHTVYHSGTIGHYHAGSKWARGRITDETLIKKVVLTEDQNKGESTLAGKPIEPAFGAEQLERLDGTNGLRIVIEDNCVITLLAASVATDYVGDDDTVDHRNRGSIVTLVELFDRTVTPTRTRKILLCADATRSTEHFVLGDVGRAARLTGVEIVQAGHHGSNRTSSGEPWVDQLKPTGYVIVSAGKVGVPNHHLPGWAVINRWVKRFEDSNRPNDATAHLVSGYDDKTEPASLVAMDVYQPVYATGSNGTRTFTIKVSP